MIHENYVYTIRHDDVVVYIGKGKNDRINSDKNEWFNLFDAELNFSREIVGYYKDAREALTVEANLIAAYKPIFNLNPGLKPAKWVELTRFTDKEIKRAKSKGAESAAPEAIAIELVNNLDDVDYSSILLLDRFGTLYEAFMRRFPNFKGKITVVEEDIDRLPKIDADFDVVRDFLAKDFGDTRFDLVLINPPYTAQNAMYKKAMKLAPVVAGIGSKGIGGANLWKKYGGTFAFFRYLSYEEMDVGVESAMVVINANYNNPLHAKYPLKFPHLRNSATLEDYDTFFNQHDGFKSKQSYFVKDKNTFGVMRDGDDYFFGRLADHKAHSIIPCDESDAPAIIEKLAKQQALHPRFGFRYKTSMQDFEGSYINRD